MTATRETYRLQLIDMVNQHHQQNGLFETNVPGVCLLHSKEQTSCTPVIYEPMLCLLLQGKKNISFGPEDLDFKQLDYMFIPVMLPATGRILQASNDSPYIGISIKLDLRELSDLLIDMADTPRPVYDEPKCVNIEPADEELLSIFKRMLALQCNTQDIPIMLPMLKRELFYRLLQRPAGQQLRQFLMYDSNANRINKVIEMIRDNYDASLKVKDLANAVHMSESTLFNSFKTVTNMSPLQFQKQIRLNEARRIMLQEGIEAAAASYKVGYESPSQFSREYSRLFGISPVKDINRVKATQQVVA